MTSGAGSGRPWSSTLRRSRRPSSSTPARARAAGAEHVALAREAYARFGKGHHAAGLNLGDCCAYALSRYSGEPLLFKGDDLARTDVVPVARS